MLSNEDIKKEIDKLPQELFYPPPSEETTFPEKQITTHSKKKKHEKKISESQLLKTAKKRQKKLEKLLLDEEQKSPTTYDQNEEKPFPIEQENKENEQDKPIQKEFDTEESQHIEENEDTEKSKENIRKQKESKRKAKEQLYQRYVTTLEEAVDWASLPKNQVTYLQTPLSTSGMYRPDIGDPPETYYILRYFDEQQGQIPSIDANDFLSPHTTTTNIPNSNSRWNSNTYSSHEMKSDLDFKNRSRNLLETDRYQIQQSRKSNRREEKSDETLAFGKLGDTADIKIEKAVPNSEQLIQLSKQYHMNVEQLLDIIYQYRQNKFKEFDHEFQNKELETIFTLASNSSIRQQYQKILKQQQQQQQQQRRRYRFLMQPRDQSKDGYSSPNDFDKSELNALDPFSQLLDSRFLDSLIDEAIPSPGERSQTIHVEEGLEKEKEQEKEPKLRKTGDDFFTQDQEFKNMMEQIDNVLKLEDGTESRLKREMDLELVPETILTDIRNNAETATQQLKQWFFQHRSSL